MRVFDIKDFTQSGLYSYIKFCHNVEGMNNEEIGIYALDKYYKYTNDIVFLTLRNSHTFSNIEKVQDRYPVIQIHPTDAQQSQQSQHTPKMPLYTGIYDIWLHDCMNIIQLGIGTASFVIPIENFVVDENNRIQIPLAFPPSPQGTQHMFMNVANMGKNILSYIPTTALYFEPLYVYINPGGSCSVHISTVYASNNIHNRIRTTKNIFYVNGTEMQCSNGSIDIKHTPRLGEANEPKKCTIM